jgi:hypothetical protein
MTIRCFQLKNKLRSTYLKFTYLAQKIYIFENFDKVKDNVKIYFLLNNNVIVFIKFLNGSFIQFLHKINSLAFQRILSLMGSSKKMYFTYNVIYYSFTLYFGNLSFFIKKFNSVKVHIKQEILKK